MQSKNKNLQKQIVESDLEKNKMNQTINDMNHKLTNVDNENKNLRYINRNKERKKKNE